MSNSIHIRPKYLLLSHLSPDKIAEKISSLLRESKSITGRVINNNVYLQLPKKDLKYWSPELSVKISKTDKGSVIKGIAGPNPKIWATFMVLYGMSIMLLIFGGILGVSGKMLGIDSVWILSVPGSILLFILIFIASKYGERLGKNQLLLLREFLDDAIKSAEKKNDTL